MKYIISEQLDSDYLQKTLIPMSQLTVDQIEEMISQTDCAILPVVGDCMEAFGIGDGDYVGVCFSRFPRPPKYKKRDGFDRRDACLCRAHYMGQSYASVKEYHGMWGAIQMVGTRYKYEDGKPFRMNAGIFADRVFGIVFACWDNAGRLKWQHDLDGFPEELGTESTIHGDNIGDPQPATAAELRMFEQKGRAVI